MTALAVILALSLINWALRRRWGDNPDAQFRFQLIMLALTFAGILAVVVALPVSGELRGQLLSLIGLLLSAAIALSSTTFIGNIMAGMMLKIVKSARPGDFITVADITGRITEMDLLHTEIQTEFRDLVTVPNMYMVSQPLKVVRASGTIISAEVSLGYDVPYTMAVEVLNRAAAKAQLKDSFTHVRELGDFSVTYRIAGLLEEVQSLISARSRLREAMLDALHGADIEIVSPTFMNTRAMAKDKIFIPKPTRKTAKKKRTQAEALAFDKADQAANIEKIRRAIDATEVELLEATNEEPGEGERVAKLEAKILALAEQLKIAEEEQKARDTAE